MKDILPEVCCGSAEDAISAASGGADRVELNSSLFHGGLTPGIGTLEVVKDAVNIPVMAMARPRQGGFRYTDIEFAVMKSDVRALLRHGADGVVFGLLKEDGTVDAERCKSLIDIADGAPCVFHRAIDVTPCWKQAPETLIALGFTRVLTSGQESDVFFGPDTVRDMIAFADGKIEILPGAGVTLKNARRIVEYTGCTQLHAAAFTRRVDPSTLNNRGIYYGGALYPSETEYDVTDAAYINHVKESLAL